MQSKVCEQVKDLEKSPLSSPGSPAGPEGARLHPRAPSQREWGEAAAGSRWTAAPRVGAPGGSTATADSDTARIRGRAWFRPAGGGEEGQPWWLQRVQVHRLRLLPDFRFLSGASSLLWDFILPEERKQGSGRSCPRPLASLRVSPQHAVHLLRFTAKPVGSPELSSRALRWPDGPSCPARPGAHVGAQVLPHSLSRGHHVAFLRKHVSPDWQEA